MSEDVASCISLITLPPQIVKLKHDERRIGMLHQWIETVCDPESNIIRELNKTVEVGRRQSFKHTRQ